MRGEGYAREAVGAMPRAMEPGRGCCVAREGRERLRVCVLDCGRASEGVGAQP